MLSRAEMASSLNIANERHNPDTAMITQLWKDFGITSGANMRILACSAHGITSEP